MSQNKKSNVKWIVIGCVILILAILFAVGPFLVKKYMVTKWQNAGQYKVVDVMMNVSGTLKLSDNKPYLFGNNNMYYVLENLNLDNLQDYVDKECSVIGRIKKPQNNETIAGNPVRLFIDVDKFVVDGVNLLSKNSEAIESENKQEEEQQQVANKSLKKAQLRVQVNTILNEPILFDVIKGKVSKFTTETLNDGEVSLIILTDEFNDKYALYKKGKDFSYLENKEVICLGREILTPKELPLIVDITTFEIFEVYDYQYNKIK